MYLKFRKISTCKFQPEFYQNVRKQIGKAYELTSAKCPDVNRLAVRISLAYALILEITSLIVESVISLSLQTSSFI